MRRQFILFVFLFSSALGAKSQGSTALIEARSSFENAKYAEALSSLNKIIESDQAEFEVWLLQGDCLQKEEKFVAATQAYKKAEQENNQSALLYANWSAALYNLEQIKEGEKQAKTALKLDPDLPEANYFMGNLKHFGYNLVAALKYYNTAIKIRPTYRDALYMRAATHAELANYSDAIRDYQLVLELDPNLEVAKYNIGVIQLVTESYDEAAKTFAELNPENLDKKKDFYFYKAEALYFAGDKEKACEYYEKAKSLGDTESAEIYQKYCIEKAERDEPEEKTRTIRATF